MRMLHSGCLRWAPSQGLEQWKDAAFSRSAVVVLGRGGCCRNMYCVVMEAWHSGVKLLEADLSVTVEPKGYCGKDRLATGGMGREYLVTWRSLA